MLFHGEVHEGPARDPKAAAIAEVIISADVNDDGQITEDEFRNKIGGGSELFESMVEDKSKRFVTSRELFQKLLPDASPALLTTSTRTTAFGCANEAVSHGACGAAGALLGNKYCGLKRDCVVAVCAPMSDATPHLTEFSRRPTCTNVFEMVFYWMTNFI